MKKYQFVGGNLTLKNYWSFFGRNGIANIGRKRTNADAMCSPYVSITDGKRL